MASGDSGDSPSNAAIGGGGGGGAMAMDIFIYKVLLESPLLEPHISSKAYGSLLVYKIFLENHPSGASYFLWPNI